MVSECCLAEAKRSAGIQAAQIVAGGCLGGMLSTAMTSGLNIPTTAIGTIAGCGSGFIIAINTYKNNVHDYYELCARQPLSFNAPSHTPNILPHSPTTYTR